MGNGISTEMKESRRSKMRQKLQNLRSRRRLSRPGAGSISGLVSQRSVSAEDFAGIALLTLIGAEMKFKDKWLACVSFGEQTFRSEISDSTDKPIWNSEKKLLLERNGPSLARISVFETNRLLKNNIIGYCELDLLEFVVQIAKGNKVDCQSGGVRVFPSRKVFCSGGSSVTKLKPRRFEGSKGWNGGEEDRLKVEKAKFEAEWEHIDVKREELRKEAEYISRQREAYSIYLKDERDNIREARGALRNQRKNDVETLNREREHFLNKLAEEHFKWRKKMQRERLTSYWVLRCRKESCEYGTEVKREEVENT